MLMVNGKLHEKWSGKKRLWIKAVHCGFSSKVWPGIFPGQDFMEEEEDNRKIVSFAGAVVAPMKLQCRGKN